MRDDSETRRDFAAMLAATMEIYGKPAPERAVMAMWWSALLRYDIAEVRDALSRHVSDPDVGQFPPKPADVVRKIDGGTAGNAALAWGKVQRAIGAVGTYRSVVFDDPAIHAAMVDLGGWAWLGRQPASELPHIQRRFEASYRAHRERGMREYPARLCGISEAQNAALGFAAEPPVLIGDAERCQQVLTGGGSVTLRLTQAGSAA